MEKTKTITRQKLATYAAMLGRDSLAASALYRYDSLAAGAERGEGQKPKIKMVTTGFVVESGPDKFRFA